VELLRHVTINKVNLNGLLIGEVLLHRDKSTRGNALLHIRFE